MGRLPEQERGIRFAPDQDSIHVAGAPQEGSSKGSVQKTEKRILKMKPFVDVRRSTEETGKKRMRFHVLPNRESR